MQEDHSVSDNHSFPVNDILADPTHPAHAGVVFLAEKVSRGEVSPCACIGPVYGEPYCACEMRRRGLPPSAEHVKAIEESNTKLKALVASGALSSEPGNTTQPEIDVADVVKSHQIRFVQLPKMDIDAVVLAAMRHLRAIGSKQLPRGIYVASRASIPERAARWKHLRDVEGWHIVSTWIDEAGDGETDDFSDLWLRIVDEIRGAERLILYVEADDFPLKGALIEVGIALAAGVKVFVVAPGVAIEARSRRPIGSWMDHPLVTLAPSMEAALEGAARRSRSDEEKAALLHRVFDKIDALPADDFTRKLATYKDGAVTKALVEMHEMSATVAATGKDND
ncbi:hypothetical protein WJ97_12235 [Burkholderia ubonensis]|nr:hypothetical protein WJ97_12235 [Burkholderia ubonensis]